MKFFKKLKWALPLALMMTIVTITTALALSIIVDGIITDWTPSGGSENDARVAIDINEDGTAGNPDIPDRWDISQVFLTNDTDSLYIRWDTFADTDYSSGFQLICIDNDPNIIPATGGDISQCDGGTNISMEGVDYIIRITLGLIFQVLECEDTDTSLGECSVVSGVTPSFAHLGTYTEVSVDLEDIGFGTPLACPDSGSQPCEMRINVYFDNGDTPEDDNVPNSGSTLVEVGSGSPTAINLTNLEAQTSTTLLIIASAAALLVILSGGSILVYKRSRA